MAYSHTEFLNETLNNPKIDLICKPYCNGEKSLDGLCPLICLGICFQTCHEALILPNPPPAAMVDIFPSVHPARPPPPAKPNGLSLLITITISVFAVIFFLFACCTIYKFYSRWQNSRVAARESRQPPEEAVEELGQDHYFDEDHLAMINPIWYIRTVGLQPSVISAISIVNYKKGDGLIEGTDCSVCLNEFQEDETLRLLPKCNHAFHIPCIDTWLRSHTNCPMCRASIVINNTSSLPPQDQIVHNPGSVEETRLDISDENHEPVRETEGDFTVDLVDEDEDASNAQDFDVLEVQPVRRSVSLDNISASMISDAFKSHPRRNSDNQFDAEKGKTDGNNQNPVRLEASSSSSTRTGPSSIIERSLSCSAKVLLSRYNNRSRNSDISR